MTPSVTARVSHDSASVRRQYRQMRKGRWPAVNDHSQHWRLLLLPVSLMTSGDTDIDHRDDTMTIAEYAILF